MKPGRITGIVGVEITCETCNELCVTERGSQIVLPDDETVTCEHCGTAYKVPARAFVVPNMNKKPARLNTMIEKMQ